MSVRKSDIARFLFSDNEKFAATDDSEKNRGDVLKKCDRENKKV